MIIDRLYEKVQQNGNSCVGLDTDIDYIPGWLKEKCQSVEESLFEFNRMIIDATEDITSCYKLQIAYYESYGLKGLMAYKRTLEYVKSKGAISIGDIKRGDIAKTAQMYAKAHFEGDFESDFITLSPYMGMDSIEPYMDYMKNKNKGAFVLLRTSNPGAKDIQYIRTDSGNHVYDEVGAQIEKLGQQVMGDCGYSSLGAVVGCTHVDEGEKIRAQFAKTYFLIPGYGAQGGKGDDVKVYLKNGNGGVVNSSRGILLAYKKVEGGEKRFDECARAEVERMNGDFRG